jgi:hypothetical protein
VWAPERNYRRRRSTDITIGCAAGGSPGSASHAETPTRRYVSPYCVRRRTSDEPAKVKITGKGRSVESA